MLFDHQFESLLDKETELLKQSLCREIDSWSGGLKEKYRAQLNCRATLQTPPSDLDNANDVAPLDSVPVQDVPLNLAIKSMVSSIGHNLQSSFQSDDLPFDLSIATSSSYQSIIKSTPSPAAAAAVKQEIAQITNNNDANNIDSNNVKHNLVAKQSAKDKIEEHKQKKCISIRAVECNSTRDCHGIFTNQHLNGSRELNDPKEDTNEFDDNNSISIPGVFFPGESRSARNVKPMTHESNVHKTKTPPILASTHHQPLSQLCNPPLNTAVRNNTANDKHANKSVDQSNSSTSTKATIDLRLQSKLSYDNMTNIEIKEEIVDDELTSTCDNTKKLDARPNTINKRCDMKIRDPSNSPRRASSSSSLGCSSECYSSDQTNKETSQSCESNTTKETVHKQTTLKVNFTHDDDAYDDYEPSLLAIGEIHRQESNKPNCDIDDANKDECKKSLKDKALTSKTKDQTETVERQLKRQKTTTKVRSDKQEETNKSECDSSNDDKLKDNSEAKNETVAPARGKSYCYSGKFLKKYSIPKIGSQSDKNETVTNNKAIPFKYKDDRSESMIGKKFITAYINCQRSSCDETFQCRDELDLHMERAHDLEPYRCPLKLCGERVRDRQALFRHFRFDHKNVTKWKCYECFTIFPMADFLYRHVIFEHYEGRFECAKKGCDFVAKHRATVIQHFKRAHVKGFVDYYSNSNYHNSKYKSDYNNNNEIGTNYYGVRSEYYPNEDSGGRAKYKVVTRKCIDDKCQVYFFTNEDLNKHLLEVHSILAHRCSLSGCGQSFKLRQELVDHIQKTHHDVTIWKCDKCPPSKAEQFRDDHSLYRHLLLFHHEGLFRCTNEQCHFVDKYRFKVFEHCESAHEPQEEPSSSSSSSSSSSYSSSPSFSVSRQCSSNNEDNKTSAFKAEKRKAFS